jgi:predicted small lipoprotein YifL
MKTTLRVLLLAMLLVLAACGNKGSLVLPDKPAASA